MVWDSQKDDEETLNRIVQLAMVLANLRGTIPTWQTNNNYHCILSVRELQNQI